MRIQRYYESQQCATRVKVAGLLTVDQAIRLAGAHSMTFAPSLLQELSESQAAEIEIQEKSLFKKSAINGVPEPEPLTYIDDEAKWREAFSNSDHGKGTVKTMQVCSHLLINRWLIDVADIQCRQLIFSLTIKSRHSR